MPIHAKSFTRGHINMHYKISNKWSERRSSFCCHSARWVATSQIHLNTSYDLSIHFMKRSEWNMHTLFHYSHFQPLFGVACAPNRCCNTMLNRTLIMHIFCQLYLKTTSRSSVRCSLLFGVMHTFSIVKRSKKLISLKKIKEKYK